MCLKPLLFRLLRGAGTSCSSITSMNSSCGGGALLTVSSTTMVSRLLEFLRGGGEWCEWCERTSSITCSLSDTEDATTVLRVDDRGLRGGDRERRRTTSSSMTDDRPGGPPPRPKHVYMSQRRRRKPATEPKTMPTIVLGWGPEPSPL